MRRVARVLVCFLTFRLVAGGGQADCSELFLLAGTEGGSGRVVSGGFSGGRRARGVRSGGWPSVGGCFVVAHVACEQAVARSTGGRCRVRSLSRRRLSSGGVPMHLGGRGLRCGRSFLRVRRLRARR